MTNTPNRNSTKYRVLAEYVKYPNGKGDGSEKRADQGDIVDDIHYRSAALLVKSGALEAVHDDKKEGVKK